MADSGSITQWIEGLGNGDPQSTDKIWHHFFQRLIHHARRRLHESPQRVADEDDVVTEAFDSFFRAAQAGKFPKLQDRDDLWEVLLMLTSRKTINQIVAQNRKKRGGGHVRGDSVFGSQNGFSILASPEPTPEFSAELAEQFKERLESLGDPVLEQVALLKLEGYSTSEIANKIGRKERTVQRKIRTIRELWTIEEDVVDSDHSLSN